MSYHYHSIIKISLKDCLILWVGCSNFIILLFHSCQIVHKMQKGIEFQALEFPCFWKFPLQKLNICATILGTNHETVNRVHSKDQISLVTTTMQCSRRCSLHSPLFLGMQHHSTVNMLHFLRSSTVKILSKAVPMRWGTIASQILLQGKRTPIAPLRAS